jgi:hypothetical protein
VHGKFVEGDNRRMYFFLTSHQVTVVIRSTNFIPPFFVLRLLWSLVFVPSSYLQYYTLIGSYLRYHQINPHNCQDGPPRINTTKTDPNMANSSIASMGIEAAAQRLLNPDGNDFDVSLLDDVVNAAYSPTDPNRAMANKALMALQETEHLWTKADTIMERARNPQSRFFGLQVLDDAIRTRFVYYPFVEWSACGGGGRYIILTPRTRKSPNSMHAQLFALVLIFIQVEGPPDRAARGYQELRRREGYTGVVGRDIGE